MSTQRRENRWQRTGCTGIAKDLGLLCMAPIARCTRADATVGTAPPLSACFDPFDDVSTGTPERLATNSLQSDYRTTKLVRRKPRRSSPPPGIGHRASSDVRALGSSPRHIPFPSGFARIHLTLPQVPIGR